MRDSPPDEARLCAGPLASIKVTRWPAASRWCAVQAPNTPATTAMWLFDPSWAALAMAGDKATPPAAASSERRVSFIRSADYPRWPLEGGGGGGGGGGGSGQASVARITEPSAQVCVAGGGGGSGGGSAIMAAAGATENALRSVSPIVRGGAVFK